jgi:membrane protein DedA with SNARE-associated domain
VPVPSELTLLFAGFAVHQGWMSFPLVMLAATAGNLVGSMLAYALGASRVLHGLPLIGTVLARWDRLIERHGMRAVFIARLLPLARTFVSLPAGARRFPLPRFIALTATGCALWAGAFIIAGLLGAGAWTKVDSVLGHVLLGIGLLMLVASVVKRRRRHRAAD